MRKILPQAYGRYSEVPRGKNYRLSQLYRRLKGQFKINKRTGLLTCRAAVTMAGRDINAVVFV